MIKGPNYQEDITTTNSYVFNIRTPKYIQWKQSKKEINTNTITLGEFNNG